MQDQTDPGQVAAGLAAVGAIAAGWWGAIKIRRKAPDMLAVRLEKLEADAGELAKSTAHLAEQSRLHAAQMSAVIEQTERYQRTTERIFDKLEEVGRNANTALTILAERGRHE